MTTAAATALNRSCFCVGVDVDHVYRTLSDAGLGDMAHRLRDTHPGLFAHQAVFMGSSDDAAMQALVDAVESVVQHPAYQAAALADAPAIAAALPPCPAVLHGFDFHLTDLGPRLIEINTNAGGITLAAASDRAVARQCQPAGTAGAGSPMDVNGGLWRMFLDVWHRVRGAHPLNRIAIVDQNPAGQYLYPEFLLFQALFQRHGVAVTIADPAELEFRRGLLRHGDDAIDLVYNRSTDFYLQAPAQAALREAALAGAVVLTPDPRAHALYANKRNLARLTDRAMLARWKIDPQVAEVLERCIPPTVIVRPEAAEDLWANRKRLFFKPARGFGSRGSYRGDKLTRGRFREVLAGDYVAQALIPPGARLAGPGDGQGFRFDVRSYVYRGRSLVLAARVYQGQTTNFRTAGGGFAPVLIPPESPGGWSC